jgi:hypothetical protein
VPKPLAVVPELEAELDALYALPPAEFTAARNDLARRLKDAGQTDASAQVKSLRKPTVPLWAVNQLARHNQKGIDALLTAGERLRAAQQDALQSGDSSALRDATATERKVLRELTQQADELLRKAGHSAAGERIASTLRSAALTAEGGDLLRRGRLSEELESSGFGAFAGMELPASPAKPKAASPSERRRREERTRKLRERASKLRGEATKATREAAKAEEALTRARKKAERADQAAARAEAQLEDNGYEE